MVIILMKRLSLLSFLLFAFLFVQAGSGGPDGFGYTWIDSDEPGGPAFNWVDITAWPDAVQVTGMADDNARGPFDLGFDFRYYWVDYSRVKIGSNGWLSFENPANLGSCFQAMPTASNTPNSTLAPFMSDLSFTSSYPTLPNVGEVWYWSNLQDSFVVSYLNVPWWNDDNGGTAPPDWAGSNSFQIIFDASDSSITYQYLDLSPGDMPFYPTCDRDIIIGLEGPLGTNGLELYREAFPADSFAIHFVYPKEDTFLVIDGSPVSCLNPESRGEIFFTDTDIPLSATIANLGNTDFPSDLNLTYKVISQQLSPQWQRNDTIAPVPVGSAVTLAFSLPNGLSNKGQYYFETELSNADDVNGTNDKQVAELLLIEQGAEYHDICYCTGFNPDAVLAWPVSFTGKFGGGVFIDPPIDAYTIDTVEAFVIGNDGLPQTPMLADFRIELLGVDTSGLPGAVLASQTVSRFDAVEDAWNTVVFDPPVSVDSSGFFLAWIQLGNGIGLGAETIGPKSRQSFEVLSDEWGPYRFREGQDLLLRAHVRDLSVGRVEELSRELAFQLGPNPGQDHFLVDFEVQKGGISSLQILDLTGKLVYAEDLGRLGPGSHTFQIQPELSAGTYLVRLRVGNSSSTLKWSSLR